MNKNVLRVQRKQQHTLYTEPNILIYSFDITTTDFYSQLTKKIKAIENFDYSYYIDIVGNFDCNNFSISTVTFINTSTAFAQLRLNKVIIARGNYTIADFSFYLLGHTKIILLKS